ncbi:MAG: hypothetical protein FJX75_12815 [Armatimonadetes bacterium]|nr:hypothetical protein [Armatimonadota bacterium]
MRTYTPHPIVPRLNVFISSKDHLADERQTAAYAVEELGMMPIRSETEFWIATTDPKEYLTQVQQSHVVLLIVEAQPSLKPGEDERGYYEYVRGEIEAALREGKAVLMFIREAASGASSSRLDGIVRDMEAYVFPRRFRNCAELRDVIVAGLLSELARRYVEEPDVIVSRRNLYSSAAALVGKTNRRIYLSQETPSLLFGPRRDQREERHFYEECMKWVQAAQDGDREREFVLLFNMEDVRREVRDNLYAYDHGPDQMREHLGELKGWVGECLQIVPLEQPVMRFAVCDQVASLWLRIGHHVFGIADRQQSTCNALIQMANEAMQTCSHPGEDFIQELIDQLEGVGRAWPASGSSAGAEGRGPFVEDPEDLLREIVRLRKAYVPELKRVAEEGTVTDQCLFLRDARARIFRECTAQELELPANFRRYFEVSDSATASFGLSLDRAHGEQHKLDVVHFGLRLMRHYWGSVRPDLRWLLVLVLNEHDEGRRVATDEGHEAKGAELIRARMRDVGGFRSEDVDRCASAVGNHAIISVRDPRRKRATDSDGALLDDTLLVADCISLLDPSRTITHACKALAGAKTGEHEDVFTEYLVNWRKRRDYMLKEIGQTLCADLVDPLQSAFEATTEVVSQFVGGTPMAELAAAVAAGSDVGAFCARYGEKPYPVLPIYHHAF